MRRRRQVAAGGLAGLMLAAAPPQAWTDDAIRVEGLVANDVPCFDAEQAQLEHRCRPADFKFPQTTRSAPNRRAALKTAAGATRWLLVSSLTTGARKGLGAPPPAAAEGRVQRAETPVAAPLNLLPNGGAGPAQVWQAKAMAEIPRCERKLGTLSIANGDDPHGWSQYNLAAPAKLLASIVQASGCFNLIERGSALNAAATERELGAGVGSPRGSNIGKGQIKAADYVLVAEIASADKAGGSAMAGVAGGLIGGRVGGLVGGIRTHRTEANTVLSLTSVRTTETLSVTDGSATKSDTSVQAGLGLPGVTGVGGGYDNTEIGRVVTLAFIQSYAKMVAELGLVEGAPTPPAKTYVTTAPVNMRESSDSRSALIRVLPPGAPLHPTGKKQGLWWEISDENNRLGWVLNTRLTPAK